MKVISFDNIATRNVF